jgi:bla regulator protein blaR1
MAVDAVRNRGILPLAVLLSVGSHLQRAPFARKIAMRIPMPAVSLTAVQITQPFRETPPPSPSTFGSVDWINVVILGIWACGFTGVALFRFRNWSYIRAAIRSSIPFEIPATVEVRVSTGLLEPGIVGFWRPILLLPAGIMERLNPRQLAAVLAHELCHVRRRDNLLALIHMIVEAVFWFYPLVWWIGARLVDERERACDEAVLCLGTEPHDYAEGILNVCKLYAESPLACVSGITGADLKRRIHSILTESVAGDLNFTNKAVLVVAGIAALATPIVVGMMNAPAVRAQSATGAAPKFEVASIKPCNAAMGSPDGIRGGNTSGGESSPGRLHLGCFVLAHEDTERGLISRAYGMFANGNRNPPWAVPPVEGGPEWIRSERYQIDAKAESPQSQEMMEGPMLQTLLEDRFHLRVHRATREIPVYALTLAKKGPRLQPFQEGSCVPLDFTKPRWHAAGPGQKNCNAYLGTGKGGSRRLDAEGMTLDEFSRFISFGLDRPVLDKTGIAGRFLFHLEFAPDEALTPSLRNGGDAAPPTVDPAGAPSLFTAIQEQLGLKLDSAKGPGTILVVDHVEKPSQN